MDENLKPTPEELQEEEGALKESKVEEIRSSVIEKYGLDEDVDGDLITKLTDDISKQQKSFSKVVSQKRSWREKATGHKPEAKKEESKGVDVDSIRKEVEETFFKRDLEEIEASDELKEEAKKLAKLKNLTIRQAFKDPYIIYLSEQEAQAKKLDKSAISAKKNGVSVKIDTSKPLDPADFDMTTKEGRDEWEKAKKAKAKS